MLEGSKRIYGPDEPRHPRRRKPNLDVGQISLDALRGSVGIDDPDKGKQPEEQGKDDAEEKSE